MGHVSWSELRVVLRGLGARLPCPLERWPDPDAEHDLPVQVVLAPWASDVAAQLLGRFGEDVVLTVGFLAYPSGRLLDRGGEVGSPPQPSTDPLLDPTDVEVTVARRLDVRSGHDLRAEVRVANHRSSPLVVSTNGSIVARVLDPSTGEVVGGFSGTVVMPLVSFTVEPGAAVAVPLTVGTASCARRLGYAVPPGEWAVEVVLELGDGPHRAPPLPLRVVE